MVVLWSTTGSRATMILYFALFFGVLCPSVFSFDPPAVFPISTRQALVAKSKQLNPSSTYSTSGWSNRAATVLTPQCLNPGVYTADRPFYWNNIDVGCRCTIIEVPSRQDGGVPDLWVHSPVTFDGPMQATLSKLGTVKYVVSPNYEHVKFAPQWSRAYPECEMWACPGLTQRMPQIAWNGEVPEGTRPKGWKGGQGSGLSAISWDTDLIQPLHINVEVNPLTQKPFFNEVIYYHTASKALIVTDLFWNYPGAVIPNAEFGQDDSWELAPVVEQIPVGSRLWKFGMDKVYAPFYNALMVQDKSEYRAIADHILCQWDVEMVIPAHGDILRGKDLIQKILTKHFQL